MFARVPVGQRGALWTRGHRKGRTAPTILAYVVFLYVLHNPLARLRRCLVVAGSKSLIPATKAECSADGNTMPAPLRCHILSPVPRVGRSLTVGEGILPREWHGRAEESHRRNHGYQELSIRGTNRVAEMLAGIRHEESYAYSDKEVRAPLEPPSIDRTGSLAIFDFITHLVLVVPRALPTRVPAAAAQHGFHRAGHPTFDVQVL